MPEKGDGDDDDLGGQCLNKNVIKVVCLCRFLIVLVIPKFKTVSVAPSVSWGSAAKLLSVLRVAHAVRLVVLVSLVFVLLLDFSQPASPKPSTL